MKELRKKRLFAHYEYYRTLPELSVERRRVIEEASEAENIHFSTVYRWFNKFEANENPSYRSDKGKPRLRINGRTITREEALRYTIKVTGLQRALEKPKEDSKPADLKSCIRALVRKHEIPAGISRSTMNRWQIEFGLDHRTRKKVEESVNARLRARHPGEWVVMDSSVSELYYLRNDNSVVRDKSLIIMDKNHREEILTKKGYRKLLLFCFVDLYSSAFWYEARVTPGENVASWLAAFFNFMERKSDPQCVQRGKPFGVYTDPGPAFVSIAWQETMESMHIQHIMTKGGRPNAKGMVESRIGHIKSSIERFMSVETISSVARYNELAQKFIVAQNIEKGFYELWQTIHKNPEYLQEFDPEYRHILGVNGKLLPVNPYGCIKLDGKEWYVERRLNGQKVEVYRLYDGTLKALFKGKTYTCVDPAFQETYMGEYRHKRVTDYDRLLREVAATGAEMRKIVDPEDFITPHPENVVLFDRAGVRAEVTTPFDNAHLESPQSAWYEIYRATGCGKNNLPREITEQIDYLLETLMEADGCIRREYIREILDDIMELEVQAQ